jgi:tetratricopeptide (TPR) repeat protein
VLETTVDLATVLIGQGRAQEALGEVDGMLAACKKDGVKVALVVDLHNMRGRALQALGKYQAAHDAHSEALQLHEELNAKAGDAPVATRPPEVAQSEAVQGLGTAELGLGKFDEALAHLERALALRQPGLMAPELRAETALTLARTLVDRTPGARARACSLGQEAVAGFQAAGPRGRDQLRQAQAWLTRQGCQTS